MSPPGSLQAVLCLQARNSCGVASALDPDGIRSSSLRSVVSEDSLGNRKNMREVFFFSLMII